MSTTKRALVYNRYLDTAGGGERACLDTCVALEQLGYSITIATYDTFKGSLSELCAIFGIQQYDSWVLKRFPDEESIGAFCKEEGFDLFLNCTFCSSLPNPAPLGLYLLMFPQHVDQATRSRLASYNLILSISEFCTLHIQSRWGKDVPCKVLPLPISQSHMTFVPRFSDKERLILLVGRFNVGGHTKCQLDAIRAFKSLKHSKVLDERWRLHIVGNVNAGPENLAYFERCQREATEAVTIESNVPFARLQELYARAGCLWQMTGFNLQQATSPEHCEHLGLVAMDALCYGAIPIVYERSGVSYLLEYGSSGFFFADFDELASIMELISTNFGEAGHKKLFDNARARASRMNFANFVSTLNQYLQGDVACQAA